MVQQLRKQGLSDKCLDVVLCAIILSICHDTVSRLVLCCRCLVIGYFYILDNFVVYREPHLIGPFECAVYARKRAIGQHPCIDVARFEVPVLLCRESTSQSIVVAR